MNWNDEVILITGASSGLGKALALRAGQLQATVILIGRNKKKLKEVSNQINKTNLNESIYFPFDLQNVEKIPSLYKKIKQKTGSPSILINCVGYQVYGFVSNTPTKVYEKNFKVNTLAPIALIQCVLPDMLEWEKGIIANVYSSIMYHSFPGVSSYCATKKALEAVHQSLKAEIHNTPIKTLCIRPGGMKTNYWKNTDVGNRMKGYKLHSDAGKDPSYVADKILKAIEKGKEEFDLSTFKDKIGYHLNYWWPEMLNKIIINKNKQLIDVHKNQMR